MKEKIIRVKLSDLPLKGNTDWERVDRMTEAELDAAAMSDPDNPPLTEEELRNFKRVFPAIAPAKIKRARKSSRLSRAG